MKILSLLREANRAWANASHDSVGAIGFAKRHGLPVRTTDEWMKILREGEDD